MRTMFKAVIFDVDGVLTCIDSIWRHIHEKLGVLDKARKNAEMYYSGKISYEEWAILDVMLWKGTPYKLIERIVTEVPLRKGAKETINELKKLGLTIAAISAGLDVITKRIKEDLNIDYIFSNQLVIKNGIVTGDVIVRVEARNKDKIMKNFCKKIGIKTKECIVVGDSFVDVPMFKIAGFSIAFNPKDQKVMNNSDIIILSHSLKPILPIIKDLLRKF